MLLTILFSALGAAPVAPAPKLAPPTPRRVVVRPAVPAIPAAAVPARLEGAEEVEIGTRDRLTLGGSYYPPATKSGLAPGVLVLHDAGKDRTQGSEYCEYLAKKGFGVLALDVRGHGRSTTAELDWSKEDEAGRTRLWSFAIRDVEAGADFLREQDKVHASNLTVVGVGAAGGLAVRHAIDDENTRAVVLIAPGENNYGFDLENGIADLEGLPTLVVTGTKQRDVAEAMQTAGHDANGGSPFVEIIAIRADDLLSESRTKSESYKWLRDEVMPKKR